MLNKALASSHKALACALLVLATAAGVRGANEYFPDNVALRELPPPRQARSSSYRTPPSHPVRETRGGGIRGRIPPSRPRARSDGQRFLLPAPPAHVPPR